MYKYCIVRGLSKRRVKQKKSSAAIQDARQQGAVWDAKAGE